LARIVFTGGPGSGKTTLLRALEPHGYRVVCDSPRAIIRDRISRGLTPRPEARDFAQQTLQMDIENYERHVTTRGQVLFDRSVLDALCTLDLVTPLSDSELGVFLSKYQYQSPAFILPPWKAIYAKDAERDHHFEHAESVYRITQNWYRRCGYQLIEVPKASVNERCAFVLQTLDTSDA
jgi:predicted ATPase